MCYKIQRRYIFLICVVFILFLIGSFYDFEISNECYIGNGVNENIFGIIFSYIGVIPAFLGWSFLGTVILFLSKKDGKYGYINASGDYVIEPIYDSTSHFSDGLAPVCYDGKWGYINAEGKVVVPLRFQMASYFEHGRAEVYLNGKAHKINTKGQCVKNCKNFYN